MHVGTAEPHNTYLVVSPFPHNAATQRRTDVETH